MRQIKHSTLKSATEVAARHGRQRGRQTDSLAGSLEKTHGRLPGVPAVIRNEVSLSAAQITSMQTRLMQKALQHRLKASKATITVSRIDGIYTVAIDMSGRLKNPSGVGSATDVMGAYARALEAAIQTKKFDTGAKHEVQSGMRGKQGGQRGATTEAPVAVPPAQPVWGLRASDVRKAKRDANRGKRQVDAYLNGKDPS